MRNCIQPRCNTCNTLCILVCATILNHFLSVKNNLSDSICLVSLCIYLYHLAFFFVIVSLSLCIALSNSEDQNFTLFTLSFHVSIIYPKSFAAHHNLVYCDNLPGVRVRYHLLFSTVSDCPTNKPLFVLK